MSRNSSNSKNGIQSSAEYYELLELYNDAVDRINSGGTGMGYSGIHYLVMHRLRQYGKFANGREDSVRVLKQLIKEYERDNNMDNEQSDEGFLSRFDNEE
jgi:23S rRNA A2030 N6-methylase RlmJ